MEQIGIFFQVVSCLLALLAAGILVWVNKEKTHSKFLLVILLIILAILNANGVLFHLGWYLQLPWMHKMAIPFSLLIAPVAYLYMRSVLNGELTYRKYDWLLLLPAILFAMNLWPYYTMPIAEKRAYLEEFYKDSSLRSKESEGLLPAYFFYFIRAVWSIFFIFLNFRLLVRFKREASEKVLSDNQAVLTWLKQLNGLLTGLVMAALFVAIIAPIKKTGFNLLDLSLGLLVMIICLQLFFRPKLLYGIFLPSPEPADMVSLPGLSGKDSLSVLESPGVTEALLVKPAPQFIITPEDAQRYKRVLEGFFAEQKPFLQVDYSLEQLVIDTNIPRYILSAFINREYGMGFREFLNRFRIEYLIQHKEKPEWKNFTLEAIAADCGFKSRITFINNFKQITGKSPSEYFKYRDQDGYIEKS